MGIRAVLLEKATSKLGIYPMEFNVSMAESRGKSRVCGECSGDSTGSGACAGVGLGERPAGARSGEARTVPGSVSIWCQFSVGLRWGVV